MKSIKTVLKSWKDKVVFIKNTLVERWKDESPKFWIDIRNLMIKIGVSATAILGADKLFDLKDSYDVPSIIFTICGYVIIACASVGLTAQITKQ
jgi:hypothetical protein